jgi:hypothetical protein
MRMGNLLIYSAAEIFCISLRALSRYRRCRASLSRKPSFGTRSRPLPDTNWRIYPEKIWDRLDTLA